MRHVVALALLFVLATPHLIQAQPSQSPGNHAVLWTVVGSGAGFGIGLTAGLAAFDDAIDSDRKVWTSAIVGAAVGGTVGYLIGRRHHRQPPKTSTSPSFKPPPTPLGDREVEQLAESIFKGFDTKLTKNSQRARRSIRGFLDCADQHPE